MAGGCGLGALSAAKEAKIWGIGVDADQLYLGSAHADERAQARRLAVNELTSWLTTATLAVGRDYLYNLKNNGVGLGSVSPKVKKSIVARTTAIGKQIAAGKIKVKPIIKF